MGPSSPTPRPKLHIGSALTLTLLLLATASAGRGLNLVDNPSFDKPGEGRVPKWTVRRISRLTSFRVEEGKLIAERKSGGSLAKDYCVQMIYPPPETLALRVSLRARPERAVGADFVFHFKDARGFPLSRRLIFHFRGTGPMRRFEADVLLPEGGRDVEISLEMRGPGRIELDDVDIRVLDPSDIRGEATAVQVRAAYWIRPRSAEGAETATLVIPLPPATETQVPVSLDIRTLPADRVRRASLARKNGRALLELTLSPLDPDRRLKVDLSVGVIVTEREGFGDLPSAVEIIPLRHLPPTLGPWGTIPRAPEIPALDGRVTVGSTDLMAVARRIARYLSREVKIEDDGPLDPVGVAKAGRGAPAGRAALGAALFRTSAVPARVVTLIRGAPPGDIRHAVEAYHKKLGWLRFGTGEKDPCPLPFSRDVLLSRSLSVLGGEPTSPECSAGSECGFDARPAFIAEKRGSMVLDPGVGPDLVDSLFRAWKKATHRSSLGPEGTRVAPEKIDLRGKAKKLDDRVADLLKEATR